MMDTNQRDLLILLERLVYNMEKQDLYKDLNYLWLLQKSFNIKSQIMLFKFFRV